MIRSLILHQLVSCTLLLLVSLSSFGETLPHVAHKGAPDVDGTGGQRVLLLEAVKTGILSSLGMDREPRPTQRASEEELRKMHQLYREKLREMSRNSSQMMRETWQSPRSTVLLPATVEQIKMHRRREQTQRRQWYRAVFYKNPDIQTELTLVRAELKISRQVLDKATSVQPEIRRDIKVKVNRMNSAAWAHIKSPVQANVTSTQDPMLDISPEVEKWMKTDESQALVVDVGIDVDGKEVLETNPTISLELGLTKPKLAQRTRQRRSNREEECDERGLCCRRSVTVSFKDIGWTDWVVAPAEYTMHFCDGACPHNYKPASMHTQVKSRLHQLNKVEIPPPCCVPFEYEPMVLMHYDSRGKLKLTPFEDLIVSQCHCA